MVQPKKAPFSPTLGAQMAAHVQQAIAGAMQAKVAEPASDAGPAAHVQAAIESAMQAKVPVPARGDGQARPGAIQRAATADAKMKVSGLSTATQGESGQIYGIWKNEQCPAAVAKSSLTMGKCLYVGKTARGQDLGSRFVEHAKLDKWAPWHVEKKGVDYSNTNPDKWPYVPRNLWIFKGVTKLDVAIAEQYYIQLYKNKGAKLLNSINAITAAKFAEVKDSGAWTTKSQYPGGFKPVDINKM